jgi:hypothetical protein
MSLRLSGGGKKHGTQSLRLNIYTYHTSETKGQEHHPGTNRPGRAEGASEVEEGDSHQGGPQAEPRSVNCGLRSETHGRDRSHPL